MWPDKKSFDCPRKRFHSVVPLPQGVDCRKANLLRVGKKRRLHTNEVAQVHASKGKTHTKKSFKYLASCSSGLAMSRESILIWRVGRVGEVGGWRFSYTALVNEDIAHLSPAPCSDYSVIHEQIKASVNPFVFFFLTSKFTTSLVMPRWQLNMFYSIRPQAPRLLSAHWKVSLASVGGRWSGACTISAQQERQSANDWSIASA